MRLTQRRQAWEFQRWCETCPAASSLPSWLSAPFPGLVCAADFGGKRSDRLETTLNGPEVKLSWKSGTCVNSLLRSGFTKMRQISWNMPGLTGNHASWNVEYPPRPPTLGPYSNRQPTGALLPCLACSFCRFACRLAIQRLIFNFSLTAGRQCENQCR